MFFIKYLYLILFQHYFNCQNPFSIVLVSVNNNNTCCFLDKMSWNMDQMLCWHENLGCLNNTVYAARESSKPLISKWMDGPLHECKEKNTFANMTKSCNCENCEFWMKTHQWELQKGAVQSNLPDSHLNSTWPGSQNASHPSVRAFSGA